MTLNQLKKLVKSGNEKAESFLWSIDEYTAAASADANFLKTHQMLGCLRVDPEAVRYHPKTGEPAQGRRTYGQWAVGKSPKKLVKPTDILL